jgi:nicotinate phosphoribosyltransferase
MPQISSALLTDLYQLNMMAAYLDHRLTDTAVFELFVRDPKARCFFPMSRSFA